MLFSTTERSFADAIRRLAYANPFDSAEQSAIRQTLADFDLGLSDAERKRPPVDSPRDSFPDVYARRIEALLQKLAVKLQAGGEEVNRDEQERYEDLIITALHLRYFATGSILAEAGDGTRPLSIFSQFCRDLKSWSAVPFEMGPFLKQPAHTFAVFFQYRFAVRLLDELIHGNSRPIARLRAATWHSIFPRELRLYGVLLFERMHEVTTLILGPSGTGKELVATAIGLARFVAFDPKRQRFAETFSGAFHPINLSAMPRDLIESEMFGHAAGAFTGATKDHEGWFAKCKRGHTVFLDELGELAESVQVRLLRVLQNREFYRVGDTEPQTFDGRVIAATNRDLSQLIDAGKFREDLYYRLCSDVISTPTLRQQLDDSPEELPSLVAYVASHCLGEKAESEFVERLAKATLKWIESSPEMGVPYEWPGNFRELEQCVRSVMVRGEYYPPTRHSHSTLTPGTTPASKSSSELERFVADVRAGRLTFDELLVRYCSLIHSHSGNLALTSRRLKKHRLTIQGRIDPAWVERFRNQ